MTIGLLLLSLLAGAILYEMAHNPPSRKSLVLWGLLVVFGIFIIPRVVPRFW